MTSTNQVSPSRHASPESMTGLEKLGERLFKLRDYTPIPIVILAILFADPEPVSLIAGIGVALVGEAIRTYGVAFIGTISRTRSYSNGELIKAGPFSLLRNPLYLGNLILSLGLSLMPMVWWLPIFVIVFFYAQYIPIVAWEEMKLKRIFGKPYFDYCAEVPSRWFPSPGKLLGSKWYVKPNDWKPALKSEKRTLTSVCGFLLVMSALFYWKVTNGEGTLPLIHKLFP